MAMSVFARIKTKACFLFIGDKKTTKPRAVDGQGCDDSFMMLHSSVRHKLYYSIAESCVARVSNGKLHPKTVGTVIDPWMSMADFSFYKDLIGVVDRDNTGNGIFTILQSGGFLSLTADSTDSQSRILLTNTY
jgi:hypothetical protein